MSCSLQLTAHFSNNYIPSSNAYTGFDVSPQQNKLPGKNTQIKIMKKTLSSIVLVVIVLSGCKKEGAGTQALRSASSAGLSATDSIMQAIAPGYVLGEYSVRGSRTVYYGQANDAGDNMKLTLDYFGVKQMTIAPDKKHLALPFGEGKYVNRGWAYLIGYDFKKGAITVEPNDKMKAGIVPGSFEALYVDYLPGYQSWTFQTRFMALEDKGDESEVIEPLGK